MAICAEVWLRTVTSSSENASDSVAADVQRSKLAVSCHERHAAYRLETNGLDHRRSRPLELFQIRSTEDAGHASRQRQARGRSVQRERHVGPDVMRLVVH